MRLNVLPESLCWDPDNWADRLLLQLAESLGSVVVLICMGSGIAYGAFRTGWAIRGMIRRYWPKKIGERIQRIRSPRLYLNLPERADPNPVIISENLYWGTPKAWEGPELRDGEFVSPRRHTADENKENLLRPSGSLTLRAAHPRPRNKRPVTQAVSASCVSSRLRSARRNSS